MSLLSLKSIELQVALPRSQDAGKIQEELSKQNQRFQESLTGAQLKQEELRRKRVNEFEEVSKARIKKEEEAAKGSIEENKDKEDLNNEEQVLDHPYLGSNIDFSG